MGALVCGVRIAPVDFAAKWTPANQALRPSLLERVVAVSKYALPVALWGLGWRRSAKLLIACVIGKNLLGLIIKTVTIPAALISLFVSKNRTYQEVTVVVSEIPARRCLIDRYRVKTPDGAFLDVVHRRQAGRGGPTVLVFSPNGPTTCLGEHWDWDFDSISFTYRGVGNSTGSPHSARDLVLDGDAMLQFALEHLKIPPTQLRFYGWSLGGGVLAESLALHPEFEKKAILDRTFASTAAFGGPFAWVVKMLGWNLDPLSAVQRMQAKNICILTHHLDRVIPPALQFPKIAEVAEIKLEGDDSRINYHRKLIQHQGSKYHAVCSFFS